MTVSYVKAFHGIKKLNTSRQIVLTEDDWRVLTEGGRNCTDLNEMNFAHFDFMMRKQVTHFKME